jgi:hypothetical protein
MGNKRQIFSIVVIAAISIVLLLPMANVHAQSAPPTGFERLCSRDPVTGGLARCIQQIYLFSLGFGSLISFLMIIVAGYRYMTAQGNSEQVASAKDTFASALIGLIIIFVAFILLYVINPDLVGFRPLPGLDLPPAP